MMLHVLFESVTEGEEVRMSGVKLEKGDHVVNTGLPMGDGVSLGVKIGKEGDTEDVMLVESSSSDSDLQYCPASPGGNIFCRRTETNHLGPARVSNRAFRSGWTAIFRQGRGEWYDN